MADVRVQIYLALDQGLADAPDYARNTARRLGLTSDPVLLVSSKSDDTYAALRTGLFVGAACVLALIGASLLVSQLAQLEQLRQRRKLLHQLTALAPDGAPAKPAPNNATRPLATDALHDRSGATDGDHGVTGGCGNSQTTPND
ncbi:hypothetical protein [Streptomyces sp. AS02]|uniref:hypothetical protein n=1 Tax=Streptomyces sp. AS02 TaxID=2938946 RepID=UPI0027B96536|nr:hypothetical protein [Streptomyces sp. AS02]